jgi:hypothetical protein
MLAELEEAEGDAALDADDEEEEEYAILNHNNTHSCRRACPHTPRSSCNDTYCFSCFLNACCPAPDV